MGLAVISLLLFPQLALIRTVQDNSLPSTQLPPTAGSSRHVYWASHLTTCLLLGVCSQPPFAFVADRDVLPFRVRGTVLHSGQKQKPFKF